MNTTTMKNRPETKQSLLERYDGGPVKLSGDSNAFYDRHVTFDQIVAESETSARDKFQAIAHSVRDVLSQRWLKTEQTCQQRNAKRVYYLSMEFLLGRALANNISNLRLEPDAEQFAKHHQLPPFYAGVALGVWFPFGSWGRIFGRKSFLIARGRRAIRSETRLSQPFLRVVSERRSTRRLCSC